MGNEWRPKARTAPDSYATRERAIKYVRALIERGPCPNPAQPVYVIAAPAISARADWRHTLSRVRNLLCGAPLSSWDEMKPRLIDLTGTERAAYLRANCRGGVFIAPGKSDTIPMGNVALAECTNFGMNGFPMFIYSDGRLIAWPDVNIRKLAPGLTSKTHAADIDLPGRTRAVLPTMAAALRSLGIDPQMNGPRAEGTTGIPSGQSGPPGARSVRFQAPSPAGMSRQDSATVPPGPAIRQR